MFWLGVFLYIFICHFVEIINCYFFFLTFRMGSFNSAPRINNADTQDDDAINFPSGLSTKDLVKHCRIMRGEQKPQLLSRNFLRPLNSNLNNLSDGMRVLQLNSVSKGERIDTHRFCNIKLINIIFSTHNFIL